MNRTALALAATLLSFASASAPAAAEGTIRIAEQFGITYLPLHVIRDQKLIEKHARAAGLGDVQVEWVKLSGGAAQNDALLSGSIDVASAGVGPALTIWHKTKGQVKAIASLGSLPSFLITNNPNVKTLQDFTSADKIAVPAVGVSVQSRTLQIAAEQAFGPGQHKKLEELTVSLPHPDATASLLSGGGQITAHFSNAPFQYQALKDPKIHKVLSSYDVLGGRATANFAYTTTTFRQNNPKTYGAFVAALKEAAAFIEADKKAAAETYVRVEKSKLDPALILSIVEDPDIRFTLIPERTFVYADFLARTGAIKTKPASWKDYFFDDVSGAEGS